MEISRHNMPNAKSVGTYEPPALVDLGTLEALTRGGTGPVTDVTTLGVTVGSR
ncbi:MAG TPA: lasso RiPP family leader peptide-containing protein [Egibacteraceae bacterium]|nr:lasso RiPP family leader peptide-containing protein [Egibacteraceae bacterium]